MTITYTNELTAEEFNALRVSVGWTAIESSLAKKGLENTAFTVCAKDCEKAVGMARVITDYGYVVYISDVVVLPEYQGKGIGREIMSKVLNYINENIALNQRKFVTLMAANGKEEFYKKFGFDASTTATGMIKWIEKKRE